jgi:hypothetical protein
MTMPQTTAGPARGSFLRSAGAVLAGLVTIFVLSLAVDQLMHSLGVYPPWGEPMNDTGLLLWALAYRCVIQVGGCYLTARLAPYAPMGHALTLGTIGVVLATAGAIAMWDLSANWYPIALVISSLPCAWLGGLLHRRQIST